MHFIKSIMMKGEILNKWRMILIQQYQSNHLIIRKEKHIKMINHQRKVQIHYIKITMMWTVISKNWRIIMMWGVIMQKWMRIIVQQHQCNQLYHLLGVLLNI